MVRVKGGTGTRKRHNKVLDLAKGYWMTRHKQFKKAKEAVLHAGEYAFVGRKNKKRDMRKLWIVRLNAGLRKNDLTYSVFIHMLKEKKIEIDRKVMSRMAVDFPNAFVALVNEVKKK